MSEMAPPVEGILDFVAHRHRIERAVPLGDIEYVDGKEPNRNGAGASKPAVGTPEPVDETMRTLMHS